MLRMSKLADYGTVVMVFLAKHPDELWTAKDIAKNTHLTVPMVSKILKKLVKATLLSSERGVMGGYRLAKSPDDISMYEIISALETSTGLTACSEHGVHCAIETVCHIKKNWQVISQVIEGALANISLALLSKNQLSPLDIQFVATPFNEVLS